MPLHPSAIPPVPKDTARVAQLSFPKGNRYLTLRDRVGVIFDDSDFRDLFSAYGQTGISPCQLALICIMQFLEDLTDRQAAEAVRSRIDWKYMLSLELSDSGFDYSVLSEFRLRLIEGNAEQRLLNLLLEECKKQGWLKKRGKQRTDSTHVLAATRNLNRLESVGETLRAALNSIATVAPNWLKAWVPAEWFDRYSRAIEEYRLPKGIDARKEYAEIIGADGMCLLERVWDDATPHELQQLPTVEILRQTWVHQYQIVECQVRLRSANNIPPAGQRMDSPYDPDARFGSKRSTTWSGYKVHWTETCDDDNVHLITHVITTHGNETDFGETEQVHQALKEKGLLPAEHLVDTAYVSCSLMLESKSVYGVDLVGPMRPNSSWQAKTPGAYDINHFKINWKTKKVTCPQEKKSRSWTSGKDSAGKPVLHIKFSTKDCRSCPARALCTRCKTAPRHLMIRTKAEHESLQAIRQEQKTKEWKERYDKRAGIEGTLARGIQVLGLRRTRYIGLAKTHLQHVLTAVAINAARLVAWFKDEPLPKLRVSRFGALASQE